MLAENVLQHLGHSQLEVAQVSGISPDGVLSILRRDGSNHQNVLLLDAASDYAVGIKVLIGFIEQLDAPVVFGPLADRIAPKCTTEPISLKLKATEELEIHCGKSSLVMRKNGKVLLKGTQIVSSATGTNRLKGGAVAIN